MNRQLVYPGSIPLETDILNSERNTMVALGAIAAALTGSATTANGLTVAPTAPASMSVQVSAGQIYALQNLDNSAFSSLGADLAHQVVKQGINLDPVTLACPAPLTTGYSVNYLIQAALTEVDDTAVVLPYYNASDPTTAWSGPANSGASQPTRRACTVALTAKPGIAASTGSQTTPAADSGCIGLYVVTVAYGQTTVTSGNISPVTNAPVMPQGGVLAALSALAATLASQTAFLSAFSNSLASNGYQKLPGGLILQWGSGSIAGSGARTGTQNFNIAFPNACLLPFAQDLGAGCYTYATSPLSNTQMQILVPAGSIGTSTSVIGTSTANYRWFALGF